MCHAKHAWVEDILLDPSCDLWEAARWWKGRCISNLPPITALDGSLTTDPVLTSATLYNHYFLWHVSSISSPTYPTPPLPPSTWLPITLDEVSSTLSSSNSSVPGLDCVTYRMLCWAHAADASLLPSLYSAVVEHGVHPWGVAKVVTILKPGKADYSSPKSHQPITLLRCLGKVLEKVLATRLMAYADHASVFTPQQFAQHHHCAPDTATSLHSLAATAISKGWVGLVVLFNISGFFDSLSPDIMRAALSHLGVDPTTVAWVDGFTHDWSVHLQLGG